ncbi:amino acid adenylation domain-containing protein [Streptomyces sp. NPDC048603]|uniref:amino acid adenylation domain-containing protein n=1 Tax=Streptomyces sp. NPDC048603 TaxID=3365577 RepID=UPI00371BB1E2
MTNQESSVLDPSLVGVASLPDLFAQRVSEHPDTIAVVCQDERVTYGQLAERSQALASYLRHLGVTVDDSVGLFVEPSVDLMVGAWGVLHAGAAYLPLSPEYPEDRVRYMIENSRASVLLAQDHLTARLRDLAPRGTRIITLHEAESFVPVHEDGQASPARADGLAYVIYTSGSTGRPKGVMIEHRSIVSQMRWMLSEHGIGPGRRVLQKTPMSFDAAQWEILAPANGATVVMGAPGVYADPEGLIETIEKYRVTSLQCVPTLLQALLDTEKLAACDSLTQIFSGGEALSRNLAVQCTQELPGVALVNLYGPTECTINASSFTVVPEELAEGPQSISIGRPAAGTEFHVLDRETLEPVGVGELGELYISGVQLARGYLHRPDLTADRFLEIEAGAGRPPVRAYRTGDLAQRNPDGTVQFAGRADNQVKLRGYRVELDEISLAIENHDWVRNAAVIVKDDARTGFQNLIACIELSEKEAALMDQGSHGSHHASKKSKLQVKAQLSNPGLRDDRDLAARPAYELPGAEPTEEQRRRVFARKTYRFYEGGQVGEHDLLELLAAGVTGGHGSREARELSAAEFGEILRWFGQYLSEERLLPKYGYASPGALYATQMYFELEGVAGLGPGRYYYHPQHHRLFLIEELPATGAARALVHFIGRNRGIEPVYKNNILEVLEIETGHMVGLFEQVLPAYGLGIKDFDFDPGVRDALDVDEADHYLGTFELVPYDGGQPESAAEVFVQAHGDRVAGLPEGQYAYEGGRLTRISDDIVLKKHVIAINQAVYDGAGFGITVVSRAREEWLEYIELGKKLQHLMMNGLGLGFMSSGYSSKSGNPLPASRRMDAILEATGRTGGPMYFFVGGRVSEIQLAHQGMREDTVHMRGPAEMIRDDLVRFLPDYMIPNRVVVFERLPQSANGKIDVKALAASEQVDAELVERPFVAPRNQAEQDIAEEWAKALRRESVSVQDDFFESGGNSLIAMTLVRQINARFGLSLPLQTVLEHPTVEQLARRARLGPDTASSRLLRLNSEKNGRPILCWPGLGGYPMNLRTLAGEIGLERPFYGVQAHGINEGELPYRTIGEMAAADIATIKKLQPSGPYTLWGYSFGARVAFETAWQLEQAGERVDEVFLIAPGSPKLRAADGSEYPREASYANDGYTTILYSVFAGRISGPDLEECLRAGRDPESFAAFISGLKGLEPALVKRIIEVVGQTYEFEYTFHELAERTLKAPVTLFKAVGDDYSFIEGSSGWSAEPPVVVDLVADHYSLLRDPDIKELVKHIRYQYGAK